MRSLVAFLLLAPFAVAQAPPTTAPVRPAPVQPPPASVQPPAPPVIRSLVPPVKDGKVTYTLELSAAAVPKPLSAYYLEAGYGEKQPGEKLGGFLKCFMEQDRFYNQENQTKRDVWLSTPLDELPADVREQAGVSNGVAYNPKYATMMVCADQAARYTRTEWNEYFNLRHDGIMFLLPEVQKLRALAAAVKVRMRGEVKAGEFDKALASARTLFGLARMLETHPSLIGNLVGLAVSNMAVDCLQEMVARPGCPNLYWSFADLPVPFVSIRDGLGGERVYVRNEFEKYIPSNRAMTEKELTDAIQAVAGWTAGEKPSTWEGAGIGMRFAALATDAKRLDAIRDRLTKAGTPAEVVKTMPKLQLVMLEDLYRYEVLRDDLFKWMNRPHPEALVGLKDTDKLVQDETKAGWVLGTLFVPMVSKVKNAQMKLDQRLATLRVIEALRLYAHENGGKLPEKLTDLKVPEPLDPVSGKSFTYSVKDGTATISGVNVTGYDTDNRVYELKLRK